MFNLNEAPNIALSAISSEKITRGCGLLWSWACCLPTLTCSVTQPDNLISDNTNYRACCYPKPVSLETNAGLQGLIDTLKYLKNPQAYSAAEQKGMSTAPRTEQMEGVVDQDIADKNDVNKHKIIKWQVENTMNILSAALDQNVIRGSYKTAIQNALSKIKTRVEHENAFANAIKPLPSASLLAPTYETPKLR